MKRDHVVLLAAIVLGAASCAERAASAADSSKAASPATEVNPPPPTGGAPGVIRAVIAEDGTDIFVLLQNEGDEPITLNPEFAITSPEPNVTLLFDPVKAEMKVRPQTRGFVIKPNLGSTNIVLFRNKVYGTSYSIASLKKSMQIPAGCYSVAVQYENMTRPDKYFSTKVVSKPAEVCFPE